MKQSLVFRKNGISLIAVLMFMLAATTASIVVFKVIGSENFSSGARLKKTEAYQSAESGLEAVQAWLSNKGSDVAGLVTQYYKSGGNINLTDVLGSVRPIKADSSRQHFSVYLQRITEEKKPTPHHKFKVLSVGTGRDGSEVRLSAIFDVGGGLYNVKVPSEQNGSCPSDFDYAYFGGSMSFSGQKHFSSAIVNGNWSKNPPIIDKDFIITGNLTASGSKVTVKGTLCVGGNYNPDNDADVKNAYFGGSNKFMGTYTGSVYCETDMTTGSAGADPITIDGGLAIGTGQLSFNNRPIRVKGSLLIGDDTNCTPNDAYINGGSIYVCDSVWTNNIDGVRNVSFDNAENVRFVHAFDGCDKSSTAIFAFNGATVDATPRYKTAAATVNYFNAYKTNAYASKTCSDKPSAARDVKTYCLDPSRLNPNENGCDGSKFKVDDQLATTLNDIKTHLSTKSPACAKDRVPSGNWVKALNDCYSNTQSTSLYGGEYLVVGWKNEANTYGNAGVSASDNPALNGKFIFVYDFSFNQNLILAPTTSGSYVMLFLTEGLPSNELKSVNCNANKDSYNYFIYSLDAINSLNNWALDCPLKGTLYFPASVCKGIKTEVNSNFSAFSDPDMIEDLMKAGILCEGKGTSSDGNCSDAEFNSSQCKYNHDLDKCPPKDPDSDCNAKTIGSEYEEKWIPVSSHLKVSLASKNISYETGVTENTLNPSVLVMPRVVRLTAKPISTGDFSKYYTFMYQNGATNSGPPTLKECKGIGNSPPLNFTSGTLNLQDNTAYECTFENPIYSNFYVRVSGDDIDPDKNPIALCTWPGDGRTIPASSEWNSSNNPTATKNNLSCSDGSTPEIGTVTWSNTGEDVGTLEPSGALKAGTYTPIITVTKCGDKTPVLTEVNCGTLTVEPPPEPKCEGLKETGVAGVPVPQPTVTCGNDSNPPHDFTGGLDWNNPAAGEYTIEAVFTDVCGDRPKGTSESCGSIKIEEVSFTCLLKDDGTDITVFMGEKIPAPKINCNNGNDATEKKFSATALPKNNDWDDDGNNAYYDTDNYNITKLGVIVTAQSAKCGSVNVSSSKECGKITVKKPTCSISSSTVAAGQLLTPTVSCGSGILGNDRIFSTPTVGCGWRVSSTKGGTSGSFTKESVGKDCKLNLDKITCNDIDLEGLEEDCGTIKVKEQGVPEISCKWENYEAGKNPSVIVEITSERGTKCEPPTVKETDWSGFWQEALPAAGPSPYKIEGFSNLGDDDIDTGIDVTVQTVCTGIMAGTYPEVCVKEAGGGSISIATGSWNGSHSPSGGTSMPVGTYTSFTCNNSSAPVRCFMTQSNSVKVNGGTAQTTTACGNPNTSYCYDTNVNCGNLTSLQILNSGVTCINNY